MNSISTLAQPPALEAPRLHLTSVRPGSRTHRTLLACGAAGPLLFALAYSIEGATRPGYNPLRDTISALSLGPDGWMQIANFVLFGVLTALSAVAWRASLAPGRGAAAIPVLKGIMAVGLVLAGVSLMDPSGAPVGSLHGAIHNVASYVTLIGTWISTFVFAARFAKEPAWRPWSVFAALSGILVIVLLAAMGMALGRHGDAGLFERLATLATLPLGLAVTVRLLLGSGRVSGPHYTAAHQSHATTKERFPRWIAAIVVAGASLMAVGAVIARVDPALLADGSSINHAATIYADYLFARNVPLAAMLLILLAGGSRRLLPAAMLLTACIQLLDIVNDLTRGDLQLVPGLVVFAVMFLLGAARLLEQPFWRPAAWTNR